MDQTAQKVGLGIGIAVLLVLLGGAGVYFFAAGKLPTMPDISLSAGTGEVVGSGDIVSVDYVGTLADGKIFDTSREEIAKKEGLYSSGRTYQPLAFTIGGEGVIAGFHTGVSGMRVGQTKTFTIPAKDAYGEATVEQSFPIRYFRDVVTEEVPMAQVQDRFEREFPRSVIPDEKNLKVGQDLSLEKGTVKAKVKALSATGVTLILENTTSPFYGKKLVVGLTGTYEKQVVKIKAIYQTGVTVDIENHANPFYGKKLEVGLTGTGPDGTALKVAKIGADEIVLAVPNTHELAGKDLTFTVTLVKKNPPAPTPAAGLPTMPEGLEEMISTGTGTGTGSAR